jgi:hypothetical protein
MSETDSLSPLVVSVVANPDSIERRLLFLLVLAPSLIFYYGMLHPHVIDAKPAFCVAWVNSSSVLTAYYLVQLLLTAVDEVPPRAAAVSYWESASRRLQSVVLLAHAAAVVWTEAASRSNARCGLEGGQRLSQIPAAAQLAAQLSVAVWILRGASWNSPLRGAYTRPLVGLLLLLPPAALLAARLLESAFVNVDLFCNVLIFSVLRWTRPASQDATHLPRRWAMLPRFVTLSLEPPTVEPRRSASPRSEGTGAPTRPAAAWPLRERPSRPSTRPPPSPGT